MDFTVTHRLGTRAFLLFMVRHVKWAFLLLVALGALWFFGRPHVSGTYSVYSDYGLKLTLLIVGIIFLFTLLRAFVEYRSYEYHFEREFFHIARGYLAREERGVVYHQIQTVTLRHGVTDRLIGVRHLVIIMNGSQYQPSEVILPALDHRKALLVQRELLKQARAHAPQYGGEKEGQSQKIPSDT
jgi:uncharacterized membrane protein YdbT with pleckstrin-like domain